MKQQVALVAVVLALSLGAGASIGERLFSNPDLNQTQLAAVGVTHNKPDQAFNGGAALALTSELRKLKDKHAAATVGGRDQQDSEQRLINISRERKIAMLKLAKENPRLFLSLALKKKDKAALPAKVQANVETETQVTGQIEVLHIDDFAKPENSHFLYSIKSGRQKLEFYSTSDLYLSSGATVRVNGFQLDNVVVANTSDPTAFTVTQAAPPPESVGDQRTLVLLVDFPDSGPRPFTVQQAQSAFFDGGFQDFMKEQSYNKISFTGDVYGWLTVAGDPNHSACGATAVTQPEVTNFLATNNVNLANYDRVVFAVWHPTSGAGGCSYVGKLDYQINGTNYRLSESWITLSQYNQPSLWGSQPFAWTNLDYLLAHEVGHGLGVRHANGWDCQDQTLYGDCQHLEYGNSFDTMGGNGYSLHFNAFYKEKLGWIPPAEILTINRDGRYIIGPLESATSTRKFAKIQPEGFATTPFYLEYRRPIGFDANLSRPDLEPNQKGLMINKIIDPSSFYAYPRLLDMSPTAAAWYDDTKQTVLGGQTIETTYDDPGYGLHLNVIGFASSTGVKFDAYLDPPTCVRHQPALSSDYWPSPVAAGGSGYAGADFVNQDTPTCGATLFRANGAVPATWSYNVYPEGDVSVPADSSWWSSISFSVPANTSPGAYNVSLGTTNLSTNLSISKTLSVQVVPPPVITSITPATAKVGDLVTLTGSGFPVWPPGSITLYSPNAGSAWIYNVASTNGTTLQFTVPAKIYGFTCGINSDCQINTPDGDYEVRVYANGAFSNMKNLFIGTLPTSILARHVFYNNSFYDTPSVQCSSLTGVATCDDNSAIDSTKRPQQPGDGPATFANYITYSKGLNGLMIDVAHPAGSPALSNVTASMFSFTMGNETEPTAVVPNPSSITVAPLNETTDRIKLIWPDRPFSGNNALSINNHTWLKVVVKSAANGGIPGLAADDIHYWGLAVGESNTPSGATPARAVVDSANDLNPVRQNTDNLARVTFVDPRAKYDYDRNSLVTAIDGPVVSSNTNSFTALLLFDRSGTPPPPPPPPPLGTPTFTVPENTLSLQ
ncbi:MAG: hypothetical protein HYT48_02230, partial [Candidatus Vogelbacteria bacterium]|nr:hypothetical protein [Candidatus Vogelbacteria bacterium]